MTLERLKKVLVERYREEHGGDVRFPAPFIVSLFAEPSAEQLEQLKNGDGNPIAEMSQINSSAGLAFNYYKLFESQVKKHYPEFEVRFEDKVAKPLYTSGGRYANLDVSYNLDGTQYYVESKFLEPYYSQIKKNSDSYKNPDYYKPFQYEAEVWLGLLKNESDFKHFDFPQLYRHLLAIRRKHDKKDKVVLQSVSWMMPESFKDAYGMKKADKDLLDELNKEMELCHKLLNDHLKKIGWSDCRFEIKHYNDMLGDIKDSPRYNDFCKQYLLD